MLYARRLLTTRIKHLIFMYTMKNNAYVAPEVELTAVNIEAGFAESISNLENPEVDDTLEW